MEKPRVLVMSDHSALHTGFATVSRNILNYLFDTGKYEIAELGWFAPPADSIKQSDKPRWQCFVTDRRTLQSHEEDKYGKNSLPAVISHFKPDVVITIGDQWMVDHSGNHRNKFDYKWIAYVPIDALPHPPHWSETFKSADIMVAYCEWAKKVMWQRCKDLKVIHIWHGVEKSIFKPMPERKEEFKALLGASGRFLVGCVARNQPRKHIPILMRAFSMLVSETRKCVQTGKIYISEPDKLYINEFLYLPDEIQFMAETRRKNYNSPFTGGPTLPFADSIPASKIGLYLHMAFTDVGWDLMEQIGRYKLEQYIIHNPNLRIGHGVTTEELAKIYNAMDVFALTPSGEGWGLPICFARNTAILCSDGKQVPIQNIKTGDKLIGQDGLTVNVLKAMRREVGEYHELSVAGYPSVFVTAEHPYLMEDGTFKEARDLKPNDWVVVGDYLAQSQVSSIDLPLLESKFGNGLNKGFKNTPFALDFDTCRMFGHYIAEGNVSKAGKYSTAIEFNFHKNEVEYAEAIHKVFNKYSIHGTTYYRGNKARVKFNLTNIGDVFANLFGHGAHAKNIPEVLMRCSNRDAQRGLIKGLFEGDGCFENASYASVSESLVYQIKQILLRFDIRSSISKDKRGCYSLVIYNPDRDAFGKVFDLPVVTKKTKSTRKPVEYLRKNENGLYLARVMKNKSVEEKIEVYNIDTDGSSTFVANGIVTHNCEAMACGTPVLVTDYSAHTDFARHGGPMVRVKAFYTEPRTNLERALADHVDLFLKLKDMRDNPEKAKQWGISGEKITQEMDWKTRICPQWEKVVDQAIELKNKTRKETYTVQPTVNYSNIEVI